MTEDALADLALARRLERAEAIAPQRDADARAGFRIACTRIQWARAATSEAMLQA